MDSSGQPWYVQPWTSLPTAFSVGPYFGTSSGSSTTGVHVGDIIVQDPAPAPPNCSISKAYVTTSGQSVAFFFETGLTGSGGTAIIPTPSVAGGCNFLPSFFQNGTSIGLGTNAWVTGYHSCAIVQLQPGVQINPGDIVTVATPSSWISCGVGNAANQVIDLAISNYTGQSCFGTESLIKTLRPGFNINPLGPWDFGYYNINANMIYEQEYQQPGGGGSTTNLGYPNVLEETVGSATQFFYPGDGGNQLDSAGVPGIPGYWMVMWDDLYPSYAGGTATSLSLGPQWSGLAGDVSVTQDSTCTSVANPGSTGTPSFRVSMASHDHRNSNRSHRSGSNVSGVSSIGSNCLFHATFLDME